MFKLFGNFVKSRFEKRVIFLERVLKNGWHGLMRNKVLTIATTLIIALMFFVFNLMLALSFASESVIESVGRKVDIRAEILPEVENYTIQTLVIRLEELPEVSDVVFLEKDEALKNFSLKYPHLISFLDRNNLQNPLPNVIRIISRQISDNPKIIQFLEGVEFARIIDQHKLVSDTEQKSRNEKILNITEFIKNAGWWLNVIFAIVVVLIIFNSINMNIHTHRKEINIMRLVGAKKSFVRGGYLFEGVIFAVMALVLSAVVSQITLLYLSRNLMGVISNESLLLGLDSILLHFEDNFWFTFGWQFFGAILVGLLSSYLAIELYLKKRFHF